MSKLIESQKLEAALAASPANVIEEADMNCMNGYDNEGSLSFEVFENGFNLALEAQGKDVFFADHEDNVIFVIASSEDEAVARVQSWKPEEYEDED
jgi:hypothetical protein